MARLVLALALASTPPIPTASDYEGLGPLDVVELTAPSDAEDPELAWTRAEELRVTCERGGTAHMCRRCAETFAGMSESEQQLWRHDAALDHGARCAARAGLVGIAQHLWSRLLTHYPESTLFHDVLIELAQSHLDVAHYQAAAELLERYARTYPHDRDGRTAALEAARLRIGLDDRAAADAGLELYASIVERRNPVAAADASWARVAIASDDDERSSLVTDYLRRYGKKGGLARLVIAKVTIGEILWKRSCPRGGVDGTCIDVTKRDAPPSCHGREVMRAKRRVKRLARAAQDHFAAALEVAGSLEEGIPPTLLAEYRDAVGTAMVRVIDPELEALPSLASPPATGVPGAPTPVAAGCGKTLDGDDEAQRWFGLVAGLIERYAAVKSAGSADRSIAADYRTGLALEHVAHALVTRAPGADTAARCEALDRTRSTLLAVARSAYEMCASRAVEHQLDGEAVVLCHRALGELGSDMFPPSYELIGVPQYARTRMQSVGVITEVPPDRASR